MAEEGMDSQAIYEHQYASNRARQDALENFHLEICHRLIEEFGWAAVPVLGGEEIDMTHAIAHLKKAVGDRALVFAFSPDGVFWMPTGKEMMDFIVMLFERPNEMHTRAKAKCEAAKELSKRQINAGVDFIVQNETVA